MDLAGVIGRSAPAVGLVRRSLSFSLPGKQFFSEALPIFGFTQPPAVSIASKGVDSSGVRQSLNLLAMDGVAGENYVNCKLSASRLLLQKNSADSSLPICGWLNYEGRCTADAFSDGIAGFFVEHSS